MGEIIFIIMWNQKNKNKIMCFNFLKDIVKIFIELETLYLFFLKWLYNFKRGKKNITYLKNF
jgi:hypothetical protein